MTSYQMDVSPSYWCKELGGGRGEARLQLVAALLALWLQLSAGQALTITTPPVDTVVSRGDSFNLTCVAMGTPSLSIVWEREGALLGNGHLVGNDLVFDEALPDHAGTYMCVASSDGQDPVTASATVTVNYIEFVNLSVSPGDEVVNGSMVTFNCTIAGHPTPNVTWFHNGQEVVDGPGVMASEEGILMLASVTLSDAGLYSCNGTNSHGMAESDMDILLKVYYPPMNIVVRVSPPDLEPLLGSKVTLTCFAVSLPASNYTWWREEGGRERLVEEGSGVMMFDGNGTLQFDMVRREDTGRYFCTAYNGYGNVSSDYTHLLVSAAPLPPGGVVLTTPTSSSVTVCWDPIINSHPPIGSYVVEYRLNLYNREWMEKVVPPLTTRLELTGLLPHAPYLVRVRGTSPAGTGDPSDNVSFMTDRGVPQQFNTTQSVNITVSGPRGLTVEWSLHPDIQETSYTFTRIMLSSQSVVSHTQESSVSGEEVTDLLPNTLYTVSLTLSFEGGQLGPAVKRLVTTPEDVPGSAPLNFTASNITSSSVLLTWAPPCPPNGVIISYNVSYQPLNGSDEIDVEVTEVTNETLFLMLSELRPFTDYNVSVFASTAEGAGPEDSLTFTTLQDAPPPPTIVEIVPVSSTALFLSWRLEGRVPGVLAGYNVTYMRNESVNVQGFIELGPNNVSVVVDGLEAWSAYNVCVSAATEGGGPGDADCDSRYTLSSVPDLLLVLEELTPLCPPSLRVTWQQVTPDLLSQLNVQEKDAVYTVTWEEVEGGGGGGGEVNEFFSTNRTSLLIPGLLVDTLYNVSLAVSNRNGTGPRAAMSVSTPTAGAPEASNLRVTPAATSLSVSWDAPPSRPQFTSYNYTIFLSPPAATDSNSTNSTSFTITDLIPATSYDVYVMANGGCGLGLPVNTSISTLEAPPGPPLVTIATVSTSSVALSLGQPDKPNGVITGFMVMCGDSEPAAVTVSEPYHECSGLPADTPLSVTAWAVNGAGRGEIVTVETSTACQSESPEVKVEGEEVRVVTGDGCPSEVHVLVVVQEQQSGVPRPLASYSVEELVELTLEYSRQRMGRQATQPAIYIAANVSRDTDFPFQLGDGANYRDYTNHPLTPDVEYVVGVVGLSGDSSQPAVFAASQTFTAPGEPEEDKMFPVVIVAAVAGALVALLAAVICVAITTYFCCRHKKRGKYIPTAQRKGSSHSFERSSSVRISGRRGNKPADPVEEYRANYHTEALESHVPVPINGFINKLLVMRTNDNQLFLEEFGSIEMTPQQPCSVAELPANRNKNRYHNILPYDHSRVKLSHSKGQSDYINASYCSGFMRVQGFIATQGPLPDTVPDFWRLVWEQNSHTIVMLTNAQERMKTKCEVYWPREVGCSTVYGSIEVTLTDFTQLADYTIRSLTINKAGSGKDVREVRQFHFTSWPDHGVPQYATAMLAMVRRVQAFHNPEGGPMVVHCSAGVGRTGTFIVIYSMIERMKASRKTVDIYGHVSLLRSQRNYMVQTEDQYFFIYEAVAEVIVCGNTEVSLELLEDYVTDILSVAHENTDSTNIELQFKRLAVDKTDAYRFASANKDVNKAKNRYVNVLPYENRRVILQYQRAQEGSDYINASFIDGYHYRNAFIATQGPLQNTLADFWRMVWEHNVPVIVMLTKCLEKGTERSAQYWPQEVGHSLACGLYSVEMTVERKSEHYTYRDLVLVDTQSGRKRQVRHFHYLSWPEVGVPASSLVLLDFIREVQKNFATLNTKSPITVHCSNGIGRSGVFIALHIVLERMVAEGLVDVFQTIKNLRIQRPAMVQTLEQYQFCYTASLDYLESSDLVNQLRSSTRSDSHSQRAASNASDLRASRRSLNRNDSLRSSTKRSSRNLEMGQVGNGVTTMVYGGSEATSTFGTSHHPGATPSLDDSPYPQTLQGVADLGDGSGTPVPLPHASPLPPSASPSLGPRLLANPHLAHLDPGSQPQLSQASSIAPSVPGSVPPLQASSYHSLAGSQGTSSPSPHPVLQSNTLPSRGGTSVLMQGHWVSSSSQSSLGRPTGGAYPVSSFGVQTGRGQSTSQDSLERQLATLALNLNNSNNNVVDVYVEQ